MRRHQLARAQRDGVPLARKLTTRTDLLGKVASLAPPLMNFANTNRLSRVAMEKTVGIHRDWVQPSYYFETVGSLVASAAAAPRAAARTGAPCCSRPAP